MPRRQRPIFAALSLLAGACTLMAPLAQPSPVVAQEASPTAVNAATAPALSVEAARAAGRRILEVMQRGDANARYAQFSDELKGLSSPSMVAATMRSQPKILSYELLSVRSGMASSTVEASITTTAGQRDLFIVLNGQGKIQRYYFDRTDEAPSKVAAAFVRALSSGNLISAHSFLSPDFQTEVSPASLQVKWQKLQRITGNFVAVHRVVEAESTADARLVLVSVQFNRLTDNLYVILDANNQITGIDFPQQPAEPQPVR